MQITNKAWRIVRIFTLYTDIWSILDIHFDFISIISILCHVYICQSFIYNSMYSFNSGLIISLVMHVFILGSHNLLVRVSKGLEIESARVHQAILYILLFRKHFYDLAWLLVIRNNLSYRGSVNFGRFRFTVSSMVSFLEPYSVDNSSSLIDTNISRVCFTKNVLFGPKLVVHPIRSLLWFLSRRPSLVEDLSRKERNHQSNTD